MKSLTRVVPVKLTVPNFLNRSSFSFLPMAVFPYLTCPSTEVGRIELSGQNGYIPIKPNTADVMDQAHSGIGHLDLTRFAA